MQSYSELLRMYSVLSDAASRVKALHDMLGEEGKQLVDVPNQYGDHATTLDVRSEEIFIAALWRWQEKNPKAKLLVHSEEHGLVVIGGGSLTYTVWLDGVDGSSVYAGSTAGQRSGEEWCMGYGPVVAVAIGENPTYDDVCVSMLARLDTGEVMYRVGTHTTRIAGSGGKTELAQGNLNKQHLLTAHVVLSDSCFPSVAQRFDEPLHAKGYLTAYSGTTIGDTFNVLDGRRVRVNGVWRHAIAVTQAFDKGNLEMPAMKHLAEGVAGAILLLDGSKLGTQEVATFAQEPGRTTFFVLVPNQPLGAHILTLL